MRRLAILGLMVCHSIAAATGGSVAIGGGDFSSVLPAGPASPAGAVAPAGPVSPTSPAAPTTTHVGAYRLDRVPVTNGEFLDFVLHHREWRRGRIPALFADSDYLSHWKAPDELGTAAQPDQPVTRVSWFAARAYCEAAGGRLPTWFEWEFAAAADESRPDARNDAGWRERILSWYEHPANSQLSRVGLGPANFYGVQDLHGLVWEW